MADEGGADSAKSLQRLGRLQEKLRRAAEHIRERDEEIAALKKAQPGDGAQVLSKAEADLLAAYKALGTPETLRKVQESGTAAESRLKALERKDKAYEAARAAQVDPEALWRLVEKDDAYELLVKEQDGRKTLAVKTADGEKTPEEAWGVLARALSPAEAPAPRANGKALPPQREARKAPARSLPDEAIDADIKHRINIGL
jgi:hypothetical protein